MKKGLTELVMILDRSGSMSGLEKDTIGGFNSMIQRQKQEKGDALVTMPSEERSIISHMFISMPGKKMYRKKLCSSLRQTAWRMPVSGIPMTK